MLEGPPGRHHPLPSARTEGGITPGSLSQAWGGRRSYVKSSWTNFFEVSEATGRTRCFTLLWGEQAFFLQKK